MQVEAGLEVRVVTIRGVEEAAAAASSECLQWPPALSRRLQSPSEVLVIKGSEEIMVASEVIPSSTILKGHSGLLSVEEEEAKNWEQILPEEAVEVVEPPVREATPHHQRPEATVATRPSKGPLREIRWEAEVVKVETVPVLVIPAGVSAGMQSSEEPGVVEVRLMYKLEQRVGVRCMGLAVEVAAVEVVMPQVALEVHGGLILQEAAGLEA